MLFCRFEHENVVRYGLIENVRGAAAITRTLLPAPSSFDDFEHGEGSEMPVNAVGSASARSPRRLSASAATTGSMPRN